MPPIDAGADAGTVPVADIGPDTCPGPAASDTDTARGADSEDTLDLRLPDELLALIAQQETEDERGRSPGTVGGTGREGLFAATGDDLLDGVADWGPIVTPAGEFHLVPVRVDQDLALIGGWMNDPAVAAFWHLAGPKTATEDHLLAQLAGDGRSVPCLGLLEGTPMSYWEVYRADLDPLARRYPARPHDTGIHLLIGAVADRGRGLGSALLRAVADLALDKRPACARVVAEPDLRNTPSVAAFLSAGFRFSAEVDLPAKRAALMIRDRSRRDLL
ncbi:GNAT family N-acetyltransferase [Streptomyces sp. NPDC002088]|uniref:GNAT family N-acetyltransferase n=1 Tax=Streptomyces sp. NPDC002088 TaxID=3154665 RepID=UPI0033227F70